LSCFEGEEIRYFLSHTSADSLTRHPTSVWKAVQGRIEAATNKSKLTYNGFEIPPSRGCLFFVSIESIMIEDFRHIESSGTFYADLCIIGSGPAGLAIATEFCGYPLEVLLLESGGLVEERDMDAQSDIESVGSPRIMEPRSVRNRVFGGTSHSWSGRCAAFDDIDFEVRPWIPFSGWPIRRTELISYLDRAAIYLGLVPNSYDADFWRLLGRTKPNTDVDHALLKSVFWQFSRDETDPLDFMRLGRRFLSSAHENIRVLLHATAIQIRTDRTGAKLDSVEIRSPEGKRAAVKPRALILCAGGIDNARLLLCSDRVVRGGVGNQNDVVGRFLMDHPRCSLGFFDVSRSGPVRDYYGMYRLGGTRSGRFFLHGLSISPEFQRKMSLLNCAAWLTEDKALDDPWDAAKRLLTGRDRKLLYDVSCLFSHPALILQGLHDRLVRRRGVRHKLARLVLDCIVEQRPNPDSRIRLSDRVDPLGVPLAQLDWRISEHEKETVAILGRLIADEFSRVGLAAPTLAPWVRTGHYDEAQFVDVAHPTGTTRMSSDPRCGVVDENCRVHGVDAIFIAGSSVFPTSGHANPTLMIVALAIRLADWLKTRLFCRTS
jgi:choline dehydrogenase-like flavoprotein